MKRIPIVATLLVAAAVATMIGLGFWQLQRAEWKDRMLADYAAAAALPALDLDPLLARGSADLPTLAFRRVLVTCRARDAAPDLRGGRSRNDQGAGGYSYFVPCRPGAQGLAGRLVVNAGWSPLPDDRRRITLDGIVAGTLGSAEAEGPIVLTSASAVPPLVPSASPTIEQIPNNHLAYASQWFFFAAAAAAIYWLALRRRGG
ncbi:SURF1 family cytochrome oxidase biogenesis protein [Sphingosinicella sp. CPCC 101087]|uniref:SURF1 family cytochrome oxidase biogenesis protein n=1 Tax=Sphingosinicella sp. CPCC 101087 TaxID=2497754 RepID=UPI00101DCAD5|nr:SURF1 family cytochrome oxidase biogenesis protein [Sphingosinicella sp. CPCC 101087]